MGLVIGRRQHRIIIIAAIVAGLWAGLSGEARADKLLLGERGDADTVTSPNVVHRRCLTPEGNDRKLGRVSGDKWSLSQTALGTDFDTTIHCLVLRFNFQYETEDNPNTTGRGVMDLSRPLDTLTDEQYIERVGHLTDPPPHDSLYFDAHMQALSRYWETVSGGQIRLTWDIFPPTRDSAYTLPYPMDHYGRCELTELVEGLEHYFVDCFRLADTTSPEIDFSDYGAYFLFHAGSDGQNDIGFPVTCSDLFSGYIKYGGEVAVDDSTFFVRDALMMPETSVQDGRATAINALLAHEFGHQLGLVDLYSTENFFTQLGDFALMDNNGFGTGIDFGWPVGRVFGAIPLYPCAWSRAFLGIDDVQDLREDTIGVMLTAAALATEPGPRVARIPITENEYYLAEVRLDEVDGNTTYILADQVTSVVQGPVDSTRAFTGEYDFLMPGSGMLIYHVDEEVAGLDYDGDGQNNFLDNDLQWWRNERKFVRLVEASGIVHFGGRYYAGFGSQQDFFRDDFKTSLTPNTNPSTFDNTGNNSHIFIDNIRRQELLDNQYDDRYMFFDLSIDRKPDNFPIRVGSPSFARAPIADDLDHDGAPELIAAAGNRIVVVTSSGEDYIKTKGNCVGCPVIYDTVTSSVNRGIGINPAAVYPVPLFGQTAGPITAGPVTGQYIAGDSTRMVAVGHPYALLGGGVTLFEATDDDNDGMADLHLTIPTIGIPWGISFGDSNLYTINSDTTDAGDTIHLVHHFSLPSVSPRRLSLAHSYYYYGHSRIGDDLAVLTSEPLIGADTRSVLHIVADSVVTYTLDGLYVWGPVTADIDRDEVPEIILFTAEGEGLILTVDMSGSVPDFTVHARESIGRLISTDPVVGDVDLDGRPDIVVGGVNELLAFNSDLTLKTDFPRRLDERFEGAGVIAPPIIADIERGGVPEIIAPNATGNIYAFGSGLAHGFPLSSGEQRWPWSNSSAVIFDDPASPKLAFLGGDGWLYAWEVEPGLQEAFWPMAGGGPEGKYEFRSESLSPVTSSGVAFDDRRFYNYPNPVRGDQTRIRYYLDSEASSVSLEIFDLSGRMLETLQGDTRGGFDHEVVWDCSGVTIGVYRCVINVELSGQTETAFTDIAIIR